MKAAMPGRTRPKELNRMPTLLPRRTLAALAAAASVLLSLAGATGAPADVVAPSIILGPTTVLDGVAVVSGSVAAPSSGSAQLSVNGQPLDLNAAGQFGGIVNLNGQSVLSVAVQNPATGDTSTVTIPLTSNLVGPGGVISSEALDALEQAAVSVLKPVGGFVSIDGKPIQVGGSVGGRDGLASLSVNGIDALSALQPNGGFAVPVPGTSKEVSVLMTDKQGVTLDTRYRVVHSRSYVAAADADGVRITKIRYFTKGVKTTKRMRMVVTVKDRRNLNVHGAVVTVRSVRTHRIVGRAKVKHTNTKGKAAFVLRVRKAAFGKLLLIGTTAKTPKAKASKRTFVRLPRLAKAHR
jgi:hypothetical protein